MSSMMRMACSLLAKSSLSKLISASLPCCAASAIDNYLSLCVFSVNAFSSSSFFNFSFTISSLKLFSLFYSIILLFI